MIDMFLKAKAISNDILHFEFVFVHVSLIIYIKKTLYVFATIEIWRQKVSYLEDVERVSYVER